MVDFVIDNSLCLIGGVLGALIWVNLDPKSYSFFQHLTPFGAMFGDIHFWVNDIFMVIFFGIATTEITKKFSKEKKSSIINPLMATFGGVIGPIIVYKLFVYITGADIEKGWAIPTATDIALAWLVARLIWAKDHPAVNFLLLLAVADDGIGLVILAVFYPDPTHPTQPLFLILVALGMLVAYLLHKRGITNFWPTIIIGGSLSWWGLHLAHLHPALALVFIVPFLKSDALTKFEHTFKKSVDVGLFGFGLVNSNVMFSSSGPATWAVLTSYLIGKPVGIFSFSYLGTKLGAELPEGMGEKDLIVVGFVAAVGLTVALFVSGVAFTTNPTAEGAAKMGALLSVFSGIIAIILAKILGVKKTI